MTENFKRLRRRVLELKRTADSRGLPHGYREIGSRLDMTAMAARRYVESDLDGRCPQCLQPLRLHSESEKNA